jgi:glycosyltransferase involved in cell wall biosynthesis
MTVSYLITLYNKADFVAASLDSVLGECAVTGGEIIIYNDASTDRSMEIVRERIAARPALSGHVRVLDGGVNRGVSHATNRVIEAAAYPYIRLIDADDMLVPGSTAQMMRLMQQHKVDYLYGGLQSCATPVGQQSYTQCVVLQDPIGTVLRHLPATPTSSFFAADKLKSIVPLPENVRRTQDFTIFLRLACSGAIMAKIDDVVALLPLVYTADNLSSGSAAAYAEQCRTVVCDSDKIPLQDLRKACGRYAGRTLKYYRVEGQSRLSPAEKLKLWSWRKSAWAASENACIVRLEQIARFFDRDRHVIKGLRKSA